MRLNEIVLETDDLEDSVNFYTHTLGLKAKLPRTDDGGQVVAVALQGSDISGCLVLAADVPEDHVVFTVDNLDNSVKKLRNKGVGVELVSHSGTRWAFFRDPNDVLIGLTEFEYPMPDEESESRLLRLNLKTNDVEGTVLFYTQILGLKELEGFAHRGNEDFVCLQVANIYIGIRKKRWLEDSGFDHIAFGVAADSLDTLVQRLEDEDVDVELFNDNGAQGVFFEDPNEVMLMLLGLQEMNTAFKTMFLMFGKIAKGDSLVSKDEIDTIEAIMAEIELDRDTRERAIEIFNRGKTTKTPFKEIAAEFAQYAEDIEFRRYVLYCLVQIAAADGVLHEQEEHHLNDAVAAFGLPPEVLTEAREEILPDMRKYYEILGCEPSVANDELTQCYRKLCQQYHPDRISSKDLAPDFLEFAEQRFKEIQNAYEIVTEHRK